MLHSPPAHLLPTLLIRANAVFRGGYIVHDDAASGRARASAETAEPRCSIAAWSTRVLVDEGTHAIIATRAGRRIKFAQVVLQ